MRTLALLLLALALCGLTEAGLDWSRVARDLMAWFVDLVDLPAAIRAGDLMYFARVLEVALWVATKGG